LSAQRRNNRSYPPTWAGAQSFTVHLCVVNIYAIRVVGEPMAYSIRVNGESRDVDVEGDTPMLWVLRDVCGLTGTKYGCGIAMCGACTIHVDGKARRACFTPVSTVGEAHVRTIETLHESHVGQALQRAWRDLDVVQCGYCQSGQLMSAAALLESNRSPSDEDIDMVMSGNICRCGTYGRIRAGIHLAAQYLSQADERPGSAAEGRTK
jgi:isoquinoline 1-oxidoreductase subunit alpha